MMDQDRQARRQNERFFWRLARGGRASAGPVNPGRLSGSLLAPARVTRSWARPSPVPRLASASSASWVLLIVHHRG